jgi:Cu2+-exporting ATPase
MECRLCGLPTPTPPIRGGGHAFCCFGCAEVYRCFGDDVLAGKATESVQPAMSVPEGAEAFLRIDGMHCSSCELLIERTALKFDGILAVASSYATSTAKIVYDPDLIDESALPELLSVAGYRARLRTDAVPEYDERQSLLRLIIGVGLAAVVMMLYLAFFYPTNLGLVELSDLRPIHWLAFQAVPRALLVLTTVLIFYVGAPIFRGAWIGLRTGMLNMDNLLALAILAAYGYSISQLVAGSLDLYFDVAAVIVVVVIVGRYLERGAKARATSELVNIMEVWTPSAHVRKDGELCDQSVEQLKPGDRIVILEGERIPLDGTVVDGQGAVDESLLTGEPVPVTRGRGEEVLGGAIVVEGTLEIEVGPSVDSRTDNLARILWNVQSSTAGVQGISDRIARIFVPVVITLAVLVSGWLLFSGSQPGPALLAGLATLIVSCPCTFGLAIPLATAVGVSTALRRGIIVTSADTFEKAPQIDIIAIDKTGILSTGEMTVVEVIGPEAVAEYAAAVERLSSHPIAEAIARLDARRTASDLAMQPGRGAVASVDGRRVAVGGKSLFATLGWDIPDRLASLTTSITTAESVVSFVGWDGRTHGAIISRDRSRPEWKAVVKALREHSRVVLLTGAEHPSEYEDQADEIYAGVPPEAKAAVIRRLRSEGTVVMIGDGSNDAPALAAADLGIAFGAPTALAADAADVVILGNRLDRLFDAFELIGVTRRRFRQNLAWALLYNATAIPLAVLGLLNPLFAALAMSASSLLVVWNSSRPIGGPETVSLPPETTQTRYRTWSRLR